MSTQKSFRVDVGVVAPSIGSSTTMYTWAATISSMSLGSTTIVMFNQNLFEGPWTGQVIIDSVNNPSEANDLWWYQASDINAITLYYDQALTNPVDSSGWANFDGVGRAHTLGYNDVTMNGPTVNISTNKADASPLQWHFNSDGSTEFPILETVRGDVLNGTLTGQTLRFGQPYNEAVITTMDGTELYQNSQRLVINPGKGADGTSGEGGDIYLWAGRGGSGGGTGGDIKIRGGYSMSTAEGGYIRIDGGDTETSGPGGYVQVTGGYSPFGAGGNISVTGGQGGTTGGNVTITGGYGGSSTGGAISLVGGPGMGGAGNINLTAGSNSWTFDNTGNLTLPTNSFTVNYANGTQVSLGGPGSYGDSNVASLLSSFGSNTITTTGAVSFGDLSSSGNLDVDGDGTVGGNLTITGNIDFSGGGTINQITSPYGYFTGNADGSNALYAGTPGGTIVPGAVAQFIGDGNAYLQINAQNQNHGTQASIEYVITGDLGTDTTDYLDIGFASSTWDGTQDNSLGNAVGARDGYMYVQGGGGGGNLVLGTTTSGKNIKFNVGGPNTGNTVAYISSTGITAVGNISAGHFSGEAGNLSNITVANITGLGNIATINKDGNASNVLLGNGVFGAAPAATAAAIANGNSNVTIATSAGNVVTNVNGALALTVSTTGIRVSGGGVIQSPGGASSITLNNNGFSAPIGNLTSGLNVTGNANVSVNVTATGNVSGATLLATNASGDEGGEIQLTKAPNGTLSGGITIDSYINKLRVFEQGGTTRGMYFDIANSPAGVSAAVGYRDVPQVVASNTTLAASDAGKHYYSTTVGNLVLTIPNNTTTSFSTGTAISIVVQAAGNILVNAASGVTLYMAGNSTAANRVVGTYGMATLLKVASDTWFINGTGVS